MLCLYSLSAGDHESNVHHHKNTFNSFPKRLARHTPRPEIETLLTTHILYLFFSVSVPWIHEWQSHTDSHSLYLPLFISLSLSISLFRGWMHSHIIVKIKTHNVFVWENNTLDFISIFISICSLLVTASKMDFHICYQGKMQSFTCYCPRYKRKNGTLINLQCHWWKRTEKRERIKNADIATNAGILEIACISKSKMKIQIFILLFNIGFIHLWLHFIGYFIFLCLKSECVKFVSCNLFLGIHVHHLTRKNKQSIWCAQSC